jgi:hypothetical protein
MMMAPPMFEQGTQLLVALISSLALAAPAPVAGQGRMMIVPTCMGGSSRIDIPADPSMPTGHECCKKGCHAAGDRRKKQQGQNEGCC